MNTSLPTLLTCKQSKAIVETWLLACCMHRHLFHIVTPRLSFPKITPRCREPVSIFKQKHARSEMDGLTVRRSALRL